MVRTSSAQKAGIHTRDLYLLRDMGVLRMLERGLYGLADWEPPSKPDLIQIALKMPNAIICLLSALSFYELTTNIPHEVHVALRRGSEPPRLTWPPLKVYWFSEAAYEEGIRTPEVDSVNIKIYSEEKTLADCFKYRNKIGLDVCIEAMRLYYERRKWKLDDLRRYAKVDRVWAAMQPYVDSLWTGQ